MLESLARQALKRQGARQAQQTRPVSSGSWEPTTWERIDGAAERIRARISALLDVLDPIENR